MNTAEARALAYYAARLGNDAEAARLYQAAADAYLISTSALAKKDKAFLLELAAEHERAASKATP